MTPLATAWRLVGALQLLVVFSTVVAAAQSLSANGPAGPLWWWAPTLIAAVAAVAAMVVALLRGWSPTPPAAAMVVIAYLGLGLGVVLEHRGLVHPPDEGRPSTWTTQLALAGVTGLAVVVRRWSPSPGLLLLVAGATVLAAWRADDAFWPDRAPSAALVDAGFVVVTTLTVHGLMRAVDEVTGQLTDARDVARAADAARRAAEDDEADRTHWEALVHDEVLSALTTARRAPAGQPREASAEAARRALRAIRAQPPRLPVPPEVLRSRLVAAVRAQHPDSVLQLDVVDPTGAGAAGSVPAHVAAAVVDAAAEAVRNVSRHAGDGALPTVSGRLGEDLVRVTISDDGRGFDPGAVDLYRLGLRISVLDRLVGVGGRARVESAAGAGTRVVLHWSADDGDAATAPPRPPAPRAAP